jgi:hypothetical protein
MKSNQVIFLALVVTVGVVLAGVFALGRNHHGKAKAIRSGGKNIVRHVSFVLPPGEMPLGETTQNINVIPAKSLSPPRP